MNKRQAEERGLQFTGCYERRQNELKPRLGKIKAAGFKAYIVVVPDSPLSRGTVSRGYSIYAERRYFVDQSIKELETHWSPKRHSDDVAALVKKHADELTALLAEQQKRNDRLAELKAEWTALNTKAPKVDEDETEKQLLEIEKDLK